MRTSRTTPVRDEPPSPAVPTPPDPTDHTRRPTEHPRGPTHSNKVKLPKLTLPRFDGRLDRWTTFWDSFESAIHTNNDLSDVDKFNYLRSLLEGSAFAAIRGLTLSAANYVDAVGILKKRFGN